MCTDELKERDDQIKQSLTEKLQIYASLYAEGTGQDTAPRGLLLRGDATDLQQGATLLQGAINDGKSRKQQQWQLQLFFLDYEFGFITQFHNVKIKYTQLSFPVESSHGSGNLCVGLSSWVLFFFVFFL